MKEEAGFAFLRDSLLFAAGLGKSRARRTPFTDSGEPIRYETQVEAMHASAFINALAVAEYPDDPEILDLPRLSERIRVFEEYANGGLDVLQEELNTRGLPLDELVLSLITDSLARSEPDNGPTIDQLLRGL